MDSDLKARWVQALRSGKYTQTTGKLCRGGCYCALGVLCDVSERGEWTEPNHYGELSYVLKDGGRWTSLVSGDWLHSTPEREDFDKVGAIMDMNDEQGKSFSEIADYIESNL